MDELKNEKTLITGPDGKKYTQEQIDAGKRALAELEADDQKLIDYISGILAKAGQEPISPERRQELLDHAAGRKQYLDGARKAVEVKKERLAYTETFDTPTVPGTNGNLVTRGYRYALKPKQEASAEQENAEYVASMNTMEGRRKLAYQLLNKLETVNEMWCVEDDFGAMVQYRTEHENEMGVAWMCEAVAHYFGSDEAADLDPQIYQRLKKRQGIFEIGGDVGMVVDGMADGLYSVISGLNERERAIISSTFGELPGLGAYEFRKRIAPINSAMISEGRLQANKEKYGTARKLLGEQGLLSGDVTFLDENGELMDHLDALEALGKGRTLTLEQYRSHVAGEGTSHKLTIREGRLEDVTADIRRMAYDEIGISEDLQEADRKLLAYEAAANGAKVAYVQPDGTRVTSTQARRNLQAGKEVDASVEDPDFKVVAANKIYRLKLTENGELQQTYQDLTTKVRDGYEAYDEAVRAIYALENGKTGSLWYAEGKEISRKEAAEAMKDGKTIQKRDFDPKRPYLGKETTAKLSEGKQKTEMGIISQQVDLNETAKTPEAQLKALEDMKKALQTTHKTGYAGMLFDSSDFTRVMDTLDATIKMLKSPKKAPSADGLQRQYDLLNSYADIYCGKKEKRIEERRAKGDNDWVGQMRLDTIRSMKSLLGDGNCKAMAGYAKKTFQQKQAAPTAKQAEAAGNTKKNEGRGLS